MNCLQTSRGVFKKAADKIKAGLPADKYTVEVVAKKGAFVVRVDGVEAPIVELLGLTRPFPKLRSLDLNEVIDKILKLQ